MEKYKRIEKGKNRVGLFRALKSTKAVCRMATGKQRVTEGWQSRAGGGATCSAGPEKVTRREKKQR